MIFGQDHRLALDDKNMAEVVFERFELSLEQILETKVNEMIRLIEHDLKEIFEKARVLDKKLRKTIMSKVRQEGIHCLQGVQKAVGLSS